MIHLPERRILVEPGGGVMAEVKYTPVAREGEERR